MPKLAKGTIARIVAMLDGGHSYSEIKAATGISTGTISDIKKKHSPGREGRAAGCPRLLNARDDRLVARTVTLGECDTAVDVAKRIEKYAVVAASPDIIRHSLRRSGLKAFVKPKKPLLCSKHIDDRY